MKIDEYERSQSAQEAAAKRYEEGCLSVPAGHLNAHDVCRLFSGQSYADWSQKPGQTARQVVKAKRLPLMEVGAGRWVVAHSLPGVA